MNLLRDKMTADRMGLQSRSKRCLILIAFLLMSVRDGDNTILSVGLGTPKEREEPKVNALLRATFKRVPGKAYGGAALDTGEPGSWYSDYVGSPTVDFDGQVY